MEGLDPGILEGMVSTQMPFGKYKGTRIDRLPTYYLEWFATQGFPKGKLGMMLATMYEIKINGLEELLTPIRRGQV